MALVTASELSSLLETAHLLRSPKNARRLLKALHRAQSSTQFWDNPYDDEDWNEA